MSTTNQSKKYLSLVTYCVVLVCLLLGFFLPITSKVAENASGTTTNGMLFMQLPSAVYSLFHIEAANIPGDVFIMSYPVTFTSNSGFYIDFGALAVVAYALFTVIGVILLIPVLASKATNKTANVCAYFVEIGAAISLFIWTVIEIIAYLATKTVDAAANYHWNYGVMGIAFGGTLLMLIIQSLGYKKSSGVAKLFQFIFGAVAVLCLFDIVTLFGLKNDMLFNDNLAVNFLTTGGAIGVFSPTYSLLFGGFEATFGTSAIQMTAAIAAVAAALLALVNFALDIAAVGASTKKGTLVIDIIRYVVEVLLVVLAIIMIFVMNFSYF